MNRYEQYLATQTAPVASPPRTERMGAIEAIDYYALHVCSPSAYPIYQFVRWVESETHRGFLWFEYDPEITEWRSYRDPR